MHHGIGARVLHGVADIAILLKIAPEKFRPRIDGQPMAFGEIIENGHCVARIQKLLHAHASDIAGPAGDKDFHCWAGLTGKRPLLQCWIYRFANIVGSKVRSRGRTVIGDFITRLRENPGRLTILGDGKQAKSYLLSGECVEAMLFIVEHASESLNIYNLGCDDSLPVIAIADMVVESLGLSGVEYQFTGGEGGWPGDVPRFRLDPSKLNRLGWTARRNSAEAVRIAIASSLESLPGVPPEPACRL